MSDQSLGTAVISGAGSGIGREIALALGRRGHRLALLGRREEPLRRTLEALGADGGHLVAPCDVREYQEVAAAARRIEKVHGPAEILVPAAGVVHLAPVDETSPDHLSEMLATNLQGAFHLIRAFLPAMKEAGRGRIFPILSVAATTAFPGWSGYCASKWGLAGLVAALRAELAGSGVLVSALYPGAVDTPLWDELPGEWDRSKMVPATEVAQALLYALDVSEPALVEEVRIGPASGAL